ncbi:Uncharacterized protein dnm_088150 [Desulfonema magnum]|uniref:Uncharacterized protein n=2 Tax=Desulfonema magnum TaxID=45655 RepID=A0A975GT52_9BACT|nr:Uncharacterized protein dnm_088150 [Desulfonema magnum]
MLAGWPVAIILLGLLLRRRQREHNAYNLLLLREELERLHSANHIDGKSEKELKRHIDKLLRQLLPSGNMSWKDRRDAAWTYLCKHLGLPPESDPPWQEQEEKLASPVTATLSAPVKSVSEAEPPKKDIFISEPSVSKHDTPPPLPATAKQKPEISPELPEIEISTPRVPIKKKPESPSPLSRSEISKPDIPPPLPVTPKKKSEPLPESLKTATVSVTPSPQAPRPKPLAPASRYAWEPAKPGDLEQALNVISGWPRVIAPFLVQNIGWFISGFLFITGCIFLVTYTAGFFRSLTIALILFGYTLVLLGGAYQLLRRRPELRTAGSVLITLGMMLIPLSMAASVRLTDIAWPDKLTSAAGILMIMANVSIFYWAAQLASGIMDRSLQGPHARVFMGLAIVQIAVPMAARIPGWYVLLLIHLTLSGLLGYGLIRFIRDWLKSIFLDQRKLAYYSTGTLVYAAIVSFVHLTWRCKTPLPPGYSGPFLMMLSGFLFYVDAQFKKWTKRYTFLSRFSFAVYALSILALSLSFQGLTARLITLTLGAGVYATVFRHYLTLPPLYLLLACVGCLYHQLILKHFSYDAYFLASIPGLSALLGIFHRTLKHKAENLARLCFQTLMILTLGLVGWSLFHAAPGRTAATTGLTLTGMLYATLRYLPYWNSQTPNHLNTPWLYIVPLAGAITLAYLPLWGGLRWTEQLPLGLTLLALLLTSIGMRTYRGITESAAMTTRVLSNSALLSVVTAIVITSLADKPATFPKNALLHLQLIVSAGVFLWQSLSMRVRALFYCALILGSAAGALIKHTHFPYPSAGITETVIILITWGIIWKLKRSSQLSAISHQPSVSSIKFQVSSIKYQISSIKFQVSPLEQFMALLWGVSLFHFIRYLPEFKISVKWGFSSGLMTLTAMLLVFYFRLLYMWWIPLLLGLSALLAPFYRAYTSNLPLLSFIGTLYALLAWLIIPWLADCALTVRLTKVMLLNGGHGGGRKQVEEQTYYTAYLITLAGIAAAVRHWLNAPGLTVLPAFIIAMAFFWLTGRHYRNRFQSHVTLTILVTVTLVIHVRVLGISNLQILPTDPRTGLLFALLSLSLWTISWLSGCKIFKNEDFPRNFAQSLYRKPLLQAATLLTFMAAGQQLVLVWGNFARYFGGTTVLTLCLASIGLLLANHRLRSQMLSLTGMLWAELGLLWIYMFLFHSGERFYLWPPRSGDIWLVLSLICMGLSFLACIMARYPQWKSLYARPLWYAAILTYGWIFLRTVLLFASAILEKKTGYYGIWLFLIMGITLFPLSEPLPKAHYWRGAGVLFMLTGWVVSILRLSHIPLWNDALLLSWGFALWGIANSVLPYFNSRFPAWSISPGAWPRAGFVFISLVLFDKWDGQLSFLPANLFSVLHWKYVLAGTAYCVLMRRNSRSSVFPWLIVTGFTITAFHLLDSSLAIITDITSQWLNLSLISLGLAALAQYLASQAGHQKTQNPDSEKTLLKTLFSPRDFRFPAWVISAVAYGWCLLGLESLPENALLPWIFLTLALGLFPLLSPFACAPVLRGIGVTLFLSLAWFSFISVYELTEYGPAALLWSYILWAAANFILTRFNKRCPRWAVDTGIWLCSGLLLVIISPVLTIGFIVFLHWTYWLSLSVYLFLILRNSKNAGLSWIAAGSLTWAGVLYVGELAGLHIIYVHEKEINRFVIGTIIWANLLLVMVSLWRHLGEKLADRLNWHAHNLTGPFLFWPAAILYPCLIFMVTNLAAIFSHHPHAWPSQVLIAGLLTASLLHLFLLHPGILNTHSLLVSVFAMTLTWIHPESALSHLPLILALWSGFLFMLAVFWSRISNSSFATHHLRHFGNIRNAVSVWLVLTQWTVMPALLFAPVASLSESLLTLGLLAGIFTGTAWIRRSSTLVWIARFLWLILLHTWPLMWIPSDQTQGLILWQIWPLLQAQFSRLQILFPWYSLQLSLIIWLLVKIRNLKLEIRNSERFLFFQEKLLGNLSFETSLAVGEWVLHLMVFLRQMTAHLPMENVWLHGTAAFISAGLLMGLGIRRFYHSQEPGWIYGVALLGGAAGVYLRLLLLGLSPPDIQDTAAIMGTAWCLFMLGRFASSEKLSAALSRLCMSLPLLALLTVPFHLSSPHAAATLMAAGALYLSLRYTSGSPMSLYLGVFSINAAIYLWIPAWANQYHLIQLYVVPAALTVLILLHLHRKELKNSTLNRVRLAGVSVLYACATLDFFLRPELSVFLVILFLSLVGVAMGIILRIRAFLYGGVIFMVLNIAGQLFLFYSRQNVGKGVVLILLGSLILVGMIWFNIRREDILKRIRIVRADLEQWK